MSQKAYIHGTAPSEQERLVLLNRMTNPAFFEFIEIPVKSKVLEIGAGMGIFAQHLAKNFSDSKIHTVEISMEQIRNCSDNIANLISIQGDAHYLPYKNDIFNVIFCRYLLEHVSQPLEVLRQIYQSLKPGGKFFIQENNILIHVFYPECPNFVHVWQQFAELQKQLGGDAEIGKRLFPLLQQSGFRNIQLSIQPEIHASGNRGFADWIRNIVGNILSGEKMLIERKKVTISEIKRALQELDNLIKREDAAAFFYWNRAKAEK
jgi:ubiquinone/menaquinone biosynthesis C-methylase UbiE